MKDLIVGGKEVNCVVIDWQEEMSQQEAMGLFHRWIISRNFLRSRMAGLDKVGQCSFVMEPVIRAKRLCSRIS